MRYYSRQVAPKPYYMYSKRAIAAISLRMALLICTLFGYITAEVKCRALGERKADGNGAKYAPKSY